MEFDKIIQNLRAIKNMQDDITKVTLIVASTGYGSIKVEWKNGDTGGVHEFPIYMNGDISKTFSEILGL